MDAYLLMPTNEHFLPRESKAYYFLLQIVNPRLAGLIEFSESICQNQLAKITMRDKK